KRSPHTTVPRASGVCRALLNSCEPSGGRATVQQSPANTGRSWHRRVRGALLDFGLWLCLLARRNQGRQDRLYLLEPDHPGPWRRQRFAGRRASSCELSACGFNQCPSNGLGSTTECGPQDRFSSGDHVRTGEARSPSWAVVPNAAHATGDTVRLDVPKGASVSACASGFTGSGCYRATRSGSAGRKFVVNTAASTQPGSTWVSVPEPAATSATCASFGRRRRSSGSRTSPQPGACFRCRFSSVIGCRPSFACHGFAA